MEAQDGKKTDPIPPSLLIGPFFFSAAVIALMLRSSSLTLWPAFLSLFGLYASWTWGKKGFAFSSLILAFTLSVWIAKKELVLWDVQISLAFLLSWYISALSVERVRKKEETPIQEEVKQAFPKEIQRMEKLEMLIKELTYDKIALRKELLAKEVSLEDKERVDTLQKELLEVQEKLFLKEKREEEDRLSDPAFPSYEELLCKTTELEASCRHLQEENILMQDLLSEFYHTKKRQYSRLKSLSSKKQAEMSLFDKS